METIQYNGRNRNWRIVIDVAILTCNILPQINIFNQHFLNQYNILSRFISILRGQPLTNYSSRMLYSFGKCNSQYFVRRSGIAAYPLGVPVGNNVVSDYSRCCQSRVIIQGVVSQILS